MTVQFENANPKENKHGTIITVKNIGRHAVIVRVIFWMPEERSWSFQSGTYKRDRRVSAICCSHKGLTRRKPVFHGHGGFDQGRANSDSGPRHSKRARS